MSSNSSHSEYPPSALKRLMNCSASKRLCGLMPEQAPGVYALQGTAAHLLASRCLELEVDATDYLGQSIEHVETRIWTKSALASCQNAGLPIPNYAINEPYTLAEWYGKVDQDMAVAVQVYLNEVRRKRALLTNYIQHIEQQYDMSWIIPGMFGTADSTLLAPFDTLYVDDYKHGAGIAVAVEDNSQLMAYGLGALGENNPYQVQRVVLTIIQPRAVHPGGPVRSWEISAKDLLVWGMDVLRPALIKTADPDALFKTGDWCKWCTGKVKCPGIINQMFDQKITPVPSKPLPVIADLSGEELDQYVEFSYLLEKWIETVREEAYKRLELALPTAPTKYKLVAGKGNRSWHNEEFITQFAQNQIGDEAFTTRQLKSVAQMEKAFQLKNVNPKDLNLFIQKNEGRPLMVPVTDSRRELSSKLEQMFQKGE